MSGRKKEIKTAFAYNVRALRRFHGYTLRGMADRLGVTISTVANWEYQKVEPSYLTLLHIADVFGVKVDDLLRPHSTTTWFIQ